MIPSELINQPAYKLSENQLYNCLKDSILQALQMIDIKMKAEHSRMVFDGCLHIIRKKFNDFTAGNLDTAFQFGLYGNYGDYAKINNKTILDWFTKRRMELRKTEELQEYQKNRTENPDFIFCSNGGHAVLLGFFYDSIGIDIQFQKRLEMIETDAICEHTGKKVREIVNDYIKQNQLLIGKKII
jgi:hypothetical protein